MKRGPLAIRKTPGGPRKMYQAVIIVLSVFGSLTKRILWDISGQVRAIGKKSLYFPAGCMRSGSARHNRRARIETMPVGMLFWRSVGSARHNRRARIETVFAFRFFLNSLGSARHNRRARIETSKCTEWEKADRVAPGITVGRGLKHREPVRQRPERTGSARHNRRARIETNSVAVI